MERRTGLRITARIDARYFHGNMFYTGTVLNFSDKGMFISTKRCLPDNAMFVVILRVADNLMKVIARVKRTEGDGECCNGMGVELIGPSASYLDFVNELA